MKNKILFTFGLITVLMFSPRVTGQSINSIQLKSKGHIPRSLTVSTLERMQIEVGLSSKRKDKKAISNNVFRIDEILHSGKIVFGSYSNDIVDKIFEQIKVSNPDIDLTKAEFFIMKSSKVNAFATYQGAICLTTGLLANIQNEAQLAYIMCHELVHFLESHTLDSYHFRSKRRGQLEDSARVSLYSNFSKNQEFEADLKGFDIYSNIGYSSNEAIEALEILRLIGKERTNMNDVKLDSTIFNSSKFKIPGSRFNLFNKDHITIEDESLYQSHPEIEKRKKKLADKIESHNVVDSKINYLVSNSNEFTEVNRLALHDDVINCMNERRYVKAIYLAEIAKNKYGSNKSLDIIVAKCLYALSKNRLPEMVNVQLTDDEKNDEHTKHFLKRAKMYDIPKRWRHNRPNKDFLKRDKALYKGDINVLNDYLSWNSSPVEIASLALHNLLELEDSNLNIYIEDIIYDLVKIYKVNKTHYYEVETLDSNHQVANVVNEIKEEAKTNLSLIEKLKSKKTKFKKVYIVKTNYYRNALVKFWNKPEVNEYFKNASKLNIVREKTKKELKREQKDREKLNVNKLIVLESDNRISDHYKGLDIPKTAKIKDKLDKALRIELNRQEIEIVDYDPNSMNSQNANLWNENVLIQQFVNEFYSYSDYGVIPLVDVTEIWKTHNTPYVLLSSEISLQSSLPINTKYIQLVTFPITLLYTMELFSKQCDNVYYATIIDLKELKVVYKKSIENNYAEQNIHKLLKVNRVCREIKSL